MKGWAEDQEEVTINMKYWVSGNHITDIAEGYWNAFECYRFRGSTPVSTYGSFNLYSNTMYTLDPVTLSGGNDDISFYFKLANNIASTDTGWLVNGASSGSGLQRRSSIIFTEVAV